MSADFAKVICFDMEMCCWSERKGLGEIISIGICELNLHNGKVEREAHYYVKPVCDEVSDFCQNLTGITPAILAKQGRPLEDVVNTIVKKFGFKRPFLAWGDDATYLARQCRRAGFTSPFRTTLDVGLIHKLKQRGGKNLSLTDALAKAGAPFQGRAHNALTDAKNLATLITRAQLI